MLKTDRRYILRERTSDAHNAVEQAVGSFETLSDYRRYLSGMAAFRLPLEAALSAAAWPAFFGPWRPHFIGPALRADLDDLQMTAAAPARDWRATGSDPEWLLGVSYVLEGSSLGARILNQRALSLGLDETSGARHLALQSSGTASWREFINLLERSGDLAIDRIVVAANDAFDAARQAFERHAPYPALRADDARQQLG